MSRSHLPLIVGAAAALIVTGLPAAAYMTGDEIARFTISVPYNELLARAKPLLARGQISQWDYNAMATFAQREKQWHAQVGPQREAELISAARAVAPDPTKSPDRKIKKAAKDLAFTQILDWETKINQFEQRRQIGPLVAKAWRVNMASYYDQESERTKGMAKREASRSRRLQQMQKEVEAEAAKARSLDNESLEEVERKLNILALFRSLRSDPEPRVRVPQLQSLTITPAGGGSFYASDPNSPNGIRYYQKIGNTYYWSE